MRQRPEIWLVASGEEPVAELAVSRYGPPWFHGTVSRREAFAAVAPLFEREQRLAADVALHLGDRWSAHRELRAQIRLLRPDGRAVPQFILHIEHRRAIWRCDAPLPEPARAQQPSCLEGGQWAAVLKTMRAAMFRVRASLALALVTMLSLAVWTAGALARGPIRHQRSDNWAGYADTASRPLTTVSGSWTQPAATCDQPGATYSAFWVGLGGFKKGSRELEQIGTEADCSGSGSQRAFSWFEILPSPPVRLNLGVHRGDRIAARVTVRGHRVRLRIANLTTRRSATRTVRMVTPDTTSAEWIAEAPSVCSGPAQCHVLPLTNFGTVAFTGSAAGLAGGGEGTITAAPFTTTEITLAGGAPGIGPMPAAQPARTGLAVPSALSDSGSSFTVTVSQQPQPQGPPAPLAAPDRLRHAPSPASGPPAPSPDSVR
jgi:hypothetical protein